jgi:cyclophilin family peptidyl-prolyl cis-trans isomerase
VPTEKRQRKKEGQAARRAAEAAARRRASRRRQAITAVVVGGIVIGLLALLSAGGSKKKTKLTSTATTVAGASTTSLTPTTATSATTVPGAAITGNTPCPKADGSSPRTTSFAKPPPMCIDTAKTYTATIQTDVGTIVVALDAKKAPKTVNNFVVLARYRFFDGIVFHRVVPGFVIQGGDPKGTGQGGPGYQFADELPKAGEYKIGSLAMANSGPNTNGSQFFIITGQQGVQLPPQYSLFGQVTQGMDVADKIDADGAPDPNPPKVLHRMVKVTITES